MADFSFPNFNVPFPYANLPAQLAGSMYNGPYSNGSQYGRWNWTNNNAFGLAPSAWPGLFGAPAPAQGAWQFPWGNNAGMGSNQGPGSNPMQPPVNVGGFPGGSPAVPPGTMAPLPNFPKSATAGVPTQQATASGAPSSAPPYPPPPMLPPGVPLGMNKAQVQTAPGQAGMIPFTVPMGASGSGNFAFSPFQSDSTQGDRQLVIRDAQGNIIGAPSAAGQNGIQYFDIGSPMIDRWGNPTQGPVLTPGQTYYASISGSAPNATPGAATLDVQANYGGTGNMQDFLRRAAMSDASSFGLTPEQRAARASAMLGGR